MNFEIARLMMSFQPFYKILQHPSSITLSSLRIVDVIVSCGRSAIRLTVVSLMSNYHFFVSNKDVKKKPKTTCCDPTGEPVRIVCQFVTFNLAN